MIKNILKPFSILFYSGIILFSTISNASEYLKNLTTGIGNKCNYIRTYQTNKNGDKNICSFSPYLSISTDKKIYNKIFLSPEFHIGIPSTTKDGAAVKLNSSFLINSKLSAHSFPLRYILGFGVDINSFFAKGGTVVLQNGNSTEEFQRPSKNAHALNLILNIGADYNFYKNYNANVYTHIFNLENSQKRAFTLGLSVDFKIGNYL